jgi:hypothetical protein
LSPAPSSSPSAVQSTGGTPPQASPTPQGRRQTAAAASGFFSRGRRLPRRPSLYWKGMASSRNAPILAGKALACFSCSCLPPLFFVYGEQ